MDLNGLKRLRSQPKFDGRCPVCTKASGYVRMGTGEYVCKCCGEISQVNVPMETHKRKGRVCCDACDCIMRYRFRTEDYICRSCGSNKFV